MKTETKGAIKTAIEKAYFSGLYNEALDMDPEDASEEDLYIKYAIMFNVETDEIFMLSYATSGSGWAEVAEGQNPWILLGYISAEDIIGGDPGEMLLERIGEVC